VRTTTATPARSGQYRRHHDSTGLNTSAQQMPVGCITYTRPWHWQWPLLPVTWIGLLLRYVVGTRAVYTVASLCYGRPFHRLLAPSWQGLYRNRPMGCGIGHVRRETARLNDNKNAVKNLLLVQSIQSNSMCSDGRS